MNNSQEQAPGQAIRYVGLLCNCSTEKNPKDELSPSLINRAFLIDRVLCPMGIRVFLFSPRDIKSPGAVPGYTIDGDGLLATIQPVPQVNANWTYGTRRLLRQGMGYSRFKRWVKDNQIRVYVPYAFAEMVSNKRKAYEVIREYDPDLHPHTEEYTGALSQVETFVGRASSVFIKPRAGNRGNRIFVLRTEPRGFSLKYYDQGGQRLFAPVTLEAAVSIVQGVVGDQSYIIQEGIESLRADGAVFDVRVVMVNDGSNWHSILETRLAPVGSDLSNIFQGGSIRVTESLLAELFGDRASLQLEQEIRRVSLGVCLHLETYFPGSLMEIGLDFIIDSDKNLHLVEVNSKPGVAGFGSETQLFEWQSDDEQSYRRWVQPHVAHLAGFLKAKIDHAGLSDT